MWIIWIESTSTTFKATSFKTFIQFLFKSQTYVNSFDLTFFIGTFFWAPILVNWYEIHSGYSTACISVPPQSYGSKLLQFCCSYLIKKKANTDKEKGTQVSHTVRKIATEGWSWFWLWRQSKLYITFIYSIFSH